MFLHSVSIYKADSFLDNRRVYQAYVLEKRGVNNLFGLAGRKKVVVNDVPEWLQWSLSVIAGFIALEFINYMIQKKKHILVWNYIKERFK